MKNPRKYRNQPTVLDGITWDSRLEAQHYQRLKAQLAAGAIRRLRWHVPYPLVVNGTKIASYIADFVYEERRGDRWFPVIEDVKSPATARLPVFRLKQKLMQALGHPVRTALSTPLGATGGARISRLAHNGPLPDEKGRNASPLWVMVKPSRECP